ncbi:MAG: hypothetical protein ACP5HK_01510 [Acidilobus sp.]
MASPELPKKIYYPDIYQLTYRPSSGCEFFEVYEVGGAYVAYCKVLESYIVRSKVGRCEKQYMTCPFRRVGLKTLGAKGSQA